PPPQGGREQAVLAAIHCPSTPPERNAHMRSRHLPQGERVTECAARSSRNLPRCSVFRVLQHNTFTCKLVADAISLLEVLCFARSVAGINQRFDLSWVQASF